VANDFWATCHSTLLSPFLRFNVRLDTLLKEVFFIRSLSGRQFRFSSVFMTGVILLGYFCFATFSSGIFDRGQNSSVLVFRELSIAAPADLLQIMVLVYLSKLLASRHPSRVTFQVSSCSLRKKPLLIDPAIICRVYEICLRCSRFGSRWPLRTSRCISFLLRSLCSGGQIAHRPPSFAVRVFSPHLSFECFFFAQRLFSLARGFFCGFGLS